jgi:hypothetical protein
MTALNDLAMSRIVHGTPGEASDRVRGLGGDNSDIRLLPGCQTVAIADRLL